MLHPRRDQQLYLLLPRTDLDPPLEDLLDPLPFEIFTNPPRLLCYGSTFLANSPHQHSHQHLVTTIFPPPPSLSAAFLSSHHRLGGSGLPPHLDVIFTATWLAIPDVSIEF